MSLPGMKSTKPQNGFARIWQLIKEKLLKVKIYAETYYASHEQFIFWSNEVTILYTHSAKY